MTPQEIIKKCDEQIVTRERLGLPKEGTEIGLIIPGRWGRGKRKRLCPGGPYGEIVSEMPQGGVMCFFDAYEVKAYLEKKLAELPVIRRWDSDTGEVEVIA